MLDAVSSLNTPFSVRRASSCNPSRLWALTTTNAPPVGPVVACQASIDEPRKSDSPTPALTPTPVLCAPAARNDPTVSQAKVAEQRAREAAILLSICPLRVGRLPNGPRLSCGALEKDSFPNLCAPPASSAC